MRILFAALAALSIPVASLAQVPAATDFSTSRAMPGTWTYQAIPGGSEARFSDTGNIARLALRCTKATRRVTLSATSSVPAPTLSLWTTSAQRAMPTRFEANAMRVSADLAATDQLLDGIAFSRGRIAFTLAGASTLVIPAWPEAARVVEDCRI